MESGTLPAALRIDRKNCNDSTTGTLQFLQDSWRQLARELTAAGEKALAKA